MYLEAVFKNADRYLNAYFFCGLKLNEIAEKCGVTSMAVLDALKRYEEAAYKLEQKRRKEENRKRQEEKSEKRKRIIDEDRIKNREYMCQKRSQENTYAQIGPVVASVSCTEK